MPNAFISFCFHNEVFNKMMPMWTGVSGVKHKLKFKQTLQIVIYPVLSRELKCLFQRSSLHLMHFIIVTMCSGLYFTHNVWIQITEHWRNNTCMQFTCFIIINKCNVTKNNKYKLHIRGFFKIGNDLKQDSL